MPMVTGHAEIQGSPDMPTGLDQSWGFADPAAAKAAGVKVISGYLSHDPSKNLNVADVRAYHAVGIGVLFNWESQAGAPLLGAAQGKADAAEAVRLAKALIAAVGKPQAPSWWKRVFRLAYRPVIYFSCDTDTNPSQWPAINAYYRAAKAVCKAAGFKIGVYGEASLVTHLHRAGITDAEWQTLAWSGGTVSPDADFYQSSINRTLGGAAVDFDKVIHAKDLGAWWPPNKPAKPKPPAKPAPKHAAATIWDQPIKAADGEEHTAATWLVMAARNNAGGVK